MTKRSLLLGLIIGGCSFAYSATNLKYSNGIEELCYGMAVALILYIVAEAYLRLTKELEYFGYATVGVLLIFVWEALKICSLGNLVLAFLIPIALVVGKYFDDELTGVFMGFMIIFPFIMCL